MRKLLIVFLVIIASIFAFSGCSNGGNQTIEVGMEMSKFMDMLNGKSADAVEAVEHFAANKEIENSEFTMYDFQDPRVTARDSDCYTLEVRVKVTIRVYEVCWDDRKIVKIELIEIK